MPTKPRIASSVGDFKKRPDPIELPSGNYMVLKKTSLAVFIQSGQIPNSLMSQIQSAVNSKKNKGKPTEDNLSAIISDPKQLAELFEAVDKYVCAAALQPRVYPTPDDESLRDDELLYVDELDDDDKMYIFQRAMGGATDLESFRAGPAPDVDPVQQREDVVVQAKRPARPKRSV